MDETINFKITIYVDGEESGYPVWLEYDIYSATFWTFFHPDVTTSKEGPFESSAEALHVGIGESMNVGNKTIHWRWAPGWN